MSKTKSTSTNKESLKAIENSFSELDKKRKELEKDMAKVGKDAVAMLKDLINESPHIKAVKWAQYTPYFNDGDTCTFGVYDIQFAFSEEIMGASDNKTLGKTAKDDDDDDEDEYDNDREYIDEYELKDFLEKKKDVINYKDIDELHKLCNTVSKVHGMLTGMDNVLQKAFGDHVEVIVTRKGIETEEYEHD